MTHTHVSLSNIISHMKYICQSPATCPSLSPQKHASHHLAHLSLPGFVSLSGVRKPQKSLNIWAALPLTLRLRDLPREPLFGGLLTCALGCFFVTPVNGAAFTRACDLRSCPGLHAQKGHVFILRPCCCCLEILNFWTRVHMSSFCTGPANYAACLAL